MTLKFYLTPNIEKFTRLIEQATKFLKQEADRGHGVEIHLTDTKDYFKFVNFMMGGYV